MKIIEGLQKRQTYMKTLHRRLGSPLLQGVDNPLLESPPIVEWFDSKKMNQGEKLLNLVLAATGVNNLRTSGLP